MSQVKNLLDLFPGSGKDAAKGSKPVDGKAKKAGAKASDLLPIETGSKESNGNGSVQDSGSLQGNRPVQGSGAHKSFQTRIKESHAKLAAASRAAAGQEAQSKATEAKTSAGTRREKAEYQRTQENQAAGHADRQEDADGKAQVRSRADRDSRSERADRHSERNSIQSRQTGRRAAEADQDAGTECSHGNTDVTYSAPSLLQDSGTAATQSPDGGKTAPLAPLDAEALKDLQAGLENLGIQASDEQLQDPAFLSQLLQMLRNLPQPQAEAETEPAPEAEPSDVSETASVSALQTATAASMEAATNAAGELTDGNEAPAPAGDKAMPAAGTETAADASIDKEALAGMIRKQIAALTADTNAPGDGNDARALGRKAVDQEMTLRSPATTPADWQGIKVRPRSESITTEPLPMADLDRMRVLQASALQAGAVGKEIDRSAMPAMETDAGADSIGETGNIRVDISESRNAGEQDNQGLSQQQADLFGGEGEASGNAETAMSKEATAAAKSASAGHAFQNSLEQTLSADHGTGIQRPWEPRPASAGAAMEQIAKHLSVAGPKHGDEINIQLSPEHLGRVRVSLEMKEGAMTARIAVENEDARRQVEAGIAGLRSTLENQGIKLQGLEVSVEQQHGSLFNPDGSNAESFFHRNGRGDKGGSGAQGASEIAPFESAPESDTGRRWGYNTMEYIG
ncbi:MAG: flagellar hook-length control protein FliK [Fibrobacteria bacterium]